MNIEIFEDIILNTVLIVFPILVYLVLVCYKNDINKNYNNLLLSIALISSLYLCLRFGIIDGNSKVLLFCNIPIVIEKEIITRSSFGTNKYFVLFFHI